MSDPPQPGPSLHERVARVIDGIRPYIQADGGNIDLVAVEGDGTVKVRLSGACAGCPHAAVTLRMGVERAVREHVPEIREVVSVE
jgi:Fe-S cluster biogenesis protein NfuA